MVARSAGCVCVQFESQKPVLREGESESQRDGQRDGQRDEADEEGDRAHETSFLKMKSDGGSASACLAMPP